MSRATILECGAAHGSDPIEPTRRARTGDAASASLRGERFAVSARLRSSIVREGTVKLSKATVSASRTKLSQAFERATRVHGIRQPASPATSPADPPTAL